MQKQWFLCKNRCFWNTHKSQCFLFRRIPKTPKTNPLTVLISSCSAQVGFSKRQLLSSLCRASWFSRQSCFFCFFFFTRLAPAREFIDQNRLADTDNTEAQRGICLSPHLLHSNSEQELVRPVHTYYYFKVSCHISDTDKTTTKIHQWPESALLCSQEMGKACMIRKHLLI